MVNRKRVLKNKLKITTFKYLNLKQMKLLNFKKLFTCSLFLILLTNLHAQNYSPSPENLEARTWFQDARFGLFVHWQRQ